MKIVLVYPPIPIVTGSLTPTSGLAYLASVLLQNGAQVSVVSSDAEQLDVDGTISKILTLSPDIMGISVSTPTANNSLKIIESIKRCKSNIRILVGGPHPTLFPEEFLNKSVDFVIRGEGEKTLAELYLHFNEKISLGGIRGLSYTKNGQYIHNPARELIEDLDTLPFPSWELFPIKRYKSDFTKKKLSLPVVSSRGCAQRCTFCYKGIFGDTYRAKSVKRVVEEIVYLKDKFNIEEFAIVDDNFALKPERAIEVCNLIISRKVNLPWTLPAGIRASAATEEFLEKLKDAGCYRAAMGIESGNQQILNSVKKGITLEQVRKAVKLFRKVGIKLVGDFMIGNLEETEETINQTINFAVELSPDYAQFTKAIPYPGTAMYNQLKKENRIITSNWDDYDYFLKSNPTFVHKNLSSEKIDDKIREAYKRFYYRPKYILKHLTEINSYRDIVNLVKNVFNFFKILLK